VQFVFFSKRIGGDAQQFTKDANHVEGKRLFVIEHLADGAFIAMINLPLPNLI
jgi:hypothetical protein